MFSFDNKKKSVKDKAHSIKNLGTSIVEDTLELNYKSDEDSNLYFDCGPQVARVLAPGFLSIISGRRGSGKSQILQPIIASCLAGVKIANWLFKSKSMRVVHIDTELPEILSDEQEATIKRISGLGDEEFKDRYIYYNLVDRTSFKAKRDAVKEIMLNEPAALYIVDNITGLSDPNNKDTAYELAYLYNAIARKTKSVVLVAGHNNNEGSARGWLGKIFEEISSTAFNLFLYEDIGTTVVTPVKDRLSQFYKTSFTVNSDTKEVIFGRYLPFPCN